MKIVWRIAGTVMGRFRRAGRMAIAAIVGLGAVGPVARPTGRRSQADAARTRPPSPPKLVRAARPLPRAGLPILTYHGFWS